MRNFYLPSSKAAAYFALSPYKYGAKLPSFIATKGNVVEALIINKFFPGMKCHNTFYHDFLGICATPDVITEDGDFVEIKSVQKKSKEKIQTDFDAYFTDDKEAMRLDRVIEDCKKVNIASHLVQCLFALYIMNDYYVEQSDCYYLVYYVELTKQLRCYRLQVYNTNKFKGWVKLLAGLFEMSGKNDPTHKRDIDEELGFKITEFLTVQQCDKWGINGADLINKE